MVKNIFLVLLLSTFAVANLQEKIISFMGEKHYAQQENLIKILFKDKNSFYKQSDGNVDSLKVIQVLQDNGLLPLSYNTPLSLHITFVTDKNPLIFTRIISESLEAIGYNFFLTQEAQKSTDQFTWTINLTTKRIINPTLFAKELEKRGCQVENIIKNSNEQWVYEIDSHDAKLNALHMEPNTRVDLSKPIQPYWIASDQAESIKIRTSLADHWFPLVLFLDKGLHLISQTKIDERTYAITLRIPENCKYIRISDIYTLDNIKRGLNVYLKQTR